MPRESKRAKRERAIEVCRRMDELYPAVKSALNFTTPFTMVICVLLSAQTTDAAVNKVTPELFRRWPDAEAMAAADPAEIAEVIRTIGFFRTKSVHCVKASQMIVSEFGGEVPQTMEELTRLPGVGRKTANIVLNKAFGIVDGIAVDTHVYRIASRLRFSNAPTPLACEQDLLALLPHELWGSVNEQWIHFGRDTCSAQRPKCDGCPLVDLCPSAFKAQGNPKARVRRRALK
ncbi:MAG: endonuclease III [Atopobiaceae bacterium]|nr:endonuclease III [Atopobiaceae bacterium]